MRLRHSDRLAIIFSKSNLNQHWLRHGRPTRRALLDRDGLWDNEFKVAAIRVLNMGLAASQEPDVPEPAEISVDDRFHELTAKRGRVDHALHAAGAGPLRHRFGLRRLRGYPRSFGFEHVRCTTHAFSIVANSGVRGAVVAVFQGRHRAHRQGFCLLSIQIKSIGFSSPTFRNQQGTSDSPCPRSRAPLKPSGPLWQPYRQSRNRSWEHFAPRRAMRMMS